MPTQEEEFFKRLRATFNAEAEEHLQAIASGLLELEKAPPPARRQILIEAVYRDAHSLKGAARAVNLTEIESTCQGMETVLGMWKQRGLSASPETFDTLHRAVDAIRDSLARSDAGQNGIDQRRYGELTQQLGRLHELATADGHAQPAAADPLPDPAPPPLAAEPSGAGETVRIATAKLDARLLQAEEMLAVKLTAAQRAADLRAVTAVFEQWRKAWAKVSAAPGIGRPALALREHSRPDGRTDNGSPPLEEFLHWNENYMRTLENRLVGLVKQARLDLQFVAKLVDDILEDSKRLLMLPFATLVNPFPKIVRDLARDQGKEVDLTIRGGDVEIDKRVLEELKDALIHTLRNAVDHGIEKPAERVRLGKPRRGTITIAASPIDGNKVEILVADDGAGVDLQRLKDSAERQGVLAQASAGLLSETETLELMFSSGVSTSPMITEISGRGLGMAIVRAKTDKLGGRVSVESRRGTGTTLRLVLPLSLARFRGILVEAGGGIFVLPTVSVERVLRIDPGTIKTVENRETLSLEGQPLALARLAAVLELPEKPKSAAGNGSVSVIVVRSAAERIAFAVDEVLREEEILVKPFKKPLARVRNIAGATLLGSGKPVPILNVADLMQSARRSAAARVPVAEPAAGATKNTVLVVEDSLTSRMLLKNILESAGFDVRTAVDGVDALAALRENHFDLVVSDVEMPRLNGFDLTGRIRADKRLAELPVVLVTALESREERERGIDAGANAYIVKSRFEQSNLLDTVRRLV